MYIYLQRGDHVANGCVGVFAWVCGSHTAVYVSLYLILLYMQRGGRVVRLRFYYICVLILLCIYDCILLYMCRHTAIYMCPQVPRCALARLLKKACECPLLNLN